MSIWFNKEITVSYFDHWGKDTMAEILEIKFTEIGENYLKATMPVDHRTHQPYGLLHGGASAALAETIGSVASHYVIDNEKFICMGLELNANHVRSAREGYVTATCAPIHLGTLTHVWDIRIHDDAGKLICVSRLTVAILEKRS